MARKKPLDPEEQQKLLLELYQQDPTTWRNNLLVDGREGTVHWGDILCPVQKQDFAALDPALKYAGRTRHWDAQAKEWKLAPKPKYQRFWIQRSRGYSKSTDIASCLIWLILFSQRKIEGIIAAEDQQQAEFVREQMGELMQFNGWMASSLELQKHKLLNKHTGSCATFVTSDTRSSFGAKPHFTLATEFTHWSDEKFWSSIFSSAAKTIDKGGMLIIDCNAGHGSGWQYKMKEEARGSELWYHHAPAGYAPWYEESTIQEQAGGLNLQEYRRLWLNEWQASDGEFVSLSEADACIDKTLIKKDKSENEDWCYVATLDYAEKEDLTVGTVAHLFNGEIIVDRQDVLHPKLMEDGIVRVEWCERWMRSVQQNFGGRSGRVLFVVDEYQLLQVIQTLEQEGFEIERFKFGSGVGNHEIAHILRSLILHRRVKWYEGCGEIRDSEGRKWPEGSRDDLSTELATLLRKKVGGRWRFCNLSGNHDDRSFGLGLACHKIVMSAEDCDWGAVIPSKDGRLRI